MPEPLTIATVGTGLFGLTAHLARRYFEIAKEVLDVVLGFIAFMIFLPLLLVCCAIIKLSDPGPALFSQIRLGKDGRPFLIYKLRTMYLNAEQSSGAVWAGKNDPRVIPACRWMRRSHVDELPQLISIIKGEMSLVGPRPERPEIYRELEHHYPNVYERLKVRPGLTGLAQVRNGYDTTIEAFRHKLQADLEYIGTRCWSLELRILASTLRKFHDTQAN
jgi:lipopolysaccharide/colanic/teichoic acid biosynthesis glycosyltransferase